MGNVSLAHLAANAEGDALIALLDSGWLRIYAGPKPTDGNTALAGQTLLSEHRFSSPAAPPTANGVITFSAITSDLDANGSGTAVWFRAYKSDGTTPVMDGTVGASGAYLNFNSVAFTQHAEIDITGLTHTVTEQ